MWRFVGRQSGVHMDMGCVPGTHTTRHTIYRKVCTCTLAALRVRVYVCTEWSVCIKSITINIVVRARVCLSVVCVCMCVNEMRVLA